MSDSNSTSTDPSGGNRARGIVDWAKRLGAIPPATDFDCEDCGRPARVYDHRDYGRPLHLAPVCQSCNVKRGAALPADAPIVPVRLESVGYVVDGSGVRGITFEAVDFTEEFPDWPTELARQGLAAPAPQPEPDALWSVWK